MFYQRARKKTPSKNLRSQHLAVEGDENQRKAHKNMFIFTIDFCSKQQNIKRRLFGGKRI